jgi:hypothetical protein
MKIEKEEKIVQEMENIEDEIYAEAEANYIGRGIILKVN